MEPKPFSMGVRIEHPQRLVNESQYCPFADAPGLGAAETDRGLADRLDPRVDGVAGLLAQHFTQQAAEQPCVLAQRKVLVGGVAGRVGVGRPVALRAAVLVFAVASVVWLLRRRTALGQVAA